LPQLRGWAPGPLRVIGFKLTVGAGARARQAAVAAQFARGAVDAVVHNDLAEIRRAARHPFRLYGTAGGRPRTLAGVPALARALDGLLAEDVS
ncbi:MAG: DNA/pantothenate metabolism flavoprotein, partial [Opitutales bacterium]